MLMTDPSSSPTPSPTLSPIPPSTGSHGTSNGARKLLRELILTIIPAALLSLLINVYVAQATVVDGPSMQPNLYTSYRVMTEKLSYHLHLPRRGDMVVVDRPGEPAPLIKRVVALPGELVEVHNGHVFINQTPIREPWVTFWGGRDYPPTIVPAAHVFVLGDNRGDSRDSREIGPVPLDVVRRHVIFVFWPLSHFKLSP
jgi:signal peptidase I